MVSPVLTASFTIFLPERRVTVLASTSISITLLLSTVGFASVGFGNTAILNEASKHHLVFSSCNVPSFAPAAHFATGTSPRSSAVADFNMDGSPDLATANTDPNNVSVLLGDGTGGFGAATNFAAATIHYYVVVGDFKEDGNPDLAAANSAPGLILLKDSSCCTVSSALLVVALSILLPYYNLL